MVVDQLAAAASRSAGPSADDAMRGSRPPASRSRTARIVDLTLAGTRYEVMKARARRAARRARVRSRGRGGRLLGAVPSRARGAADRRQRRRGEAARGVPGARRAGCAGAARRSRRAELPHARGLRRRGRGGAVRAGCRGRRARMRERRAPAPAARSTSSRPTACSTALGVPRAPRLPLDVDPKCRRLPFAYPVAVKVLSAEIAHKRDVGGVVLGIADGGGARRGDRRAMRARRRRRSSACWCSRWSRRRRGADRLPGRCAMSAAWSCWPPAASRPRSTATAACGSRRSTSTTAREMIAEVRGLRRSPVTAASRPAISTRWRARSWRCRSSRTTRRCARPRSTRCWCAPTAWSRSTPWCGWHKTRRVGKGAALRAVPTW